MGLVFLDEARYSDAVQTLLRYVQQLLVRSGEVFGEHSPHEVVVEGNVIEGGRSRILKCCCYADDGVA